MLTTILTVAKVTAVFVGKAYIGYKIGEAASKATDNIVEHIGSAIKKGKS